MKVLRPIFVLLVLAAVPAILMLGRGGVAAIPPVFDASLTLAAAMEQSRATGRPVAAFATADWCAPCQAMKRGPLRDPAVAAFLQVRTIPVYVNIEKDAAAAAVLRVTSVPTTLIIAGGTIISRSSGLVEAGNYLSFLEASVDLAGKPDEVEKLRREMR